MLVPNILIILAVICCPSHGLSPDGVLSESGSTASSPLSKPLFSAVLTVPLGTKQKPASDDLTVISSNHPRFYPWDKQDVTSAKDYQQNFCSSRCDGGQIIDIWKDDIYCSNVKCFSCQCTRPACEIYDICCPNITEHQIQILAIPVEDYDSHISLSTPISDIAIPTLFLSGNVETSNAENTSANRSLFEITNSHPLIVQKADDFTWLSNKTYKTTVFCDDKANYKSTAHLYIRSCPPEFMTATVKSMCEEDTFPAQASMVTLSRVTDKATNVTYYNKYCAECNGVTEMVPWLFNIDCLHNMYVYSATNLQELLTLSLLPGSDCDIRQEMPNNIRGFECKSFYYREDKLIDRCNVSGRWTDYDEDVKHACEGDQLSSVFYRVDTDRVLYKNVFCYICNNERYPMTGKCINKNNGGQHVERPFSLLLGFTESLNKQQQTAYVSPFTYSANCSVSEWPSPNGDCLPLQCNPGKRQQGTSCFTVLPTINSLGYKLHLWFLPDGNVSPILLTHNLQEANRNILNKFVKEVEDFLDSLTAHFKLTFGMAFNRSADHLPKVIPRSSPVTSSCSGPNSCHLSHAFVDGLIISSKNLSRDEFESILLKDLLNSTVNIEINNGTEVRLKPTIMMKELELSYCDSFKAAHRTSSCQSSLQQKQYNVEMYPRIYVAENSFLEVATILSCSFISFDKSNYALTWIENSVPPMASLTLNLQETNVTFSEPADFNQLNIGSSGTLQICAKLLEDKLRLIEERSRLEFYKKNKFESQVDESTFAQYVLTLICMSASMLCLAASLLTYLRFSVLRSVAGKNNMFLCASLLLAQAFLLAAAHVSGPSPLCTIIGILTHSMWLCMFCWSFICCFHMFRVFTAKTRNSHSSTRSERLQLLKRVMTSVLTPALIIVIVMVTSYLNSETAEIGYGDRACYLDSNLLIGLSTILPLGVVIICNLTFFIITVVKIHNVSKLQSHDSFKKEDRQNLYVYIKLSTMTGAFWTIFIIAEALNLDALRYIAIVVNGLQGVSIFISYICNKRVLDLYRYRFGLRPSITASVLKQQPKTDRSTLGKPASAIHHRNCHSKEHEGIKSHNGDSKKCGLDIGDRHLNVESRDPKLARKDSDTPSKKSMPTDSTALQSGTREMD